MKKKKILDINQLITKDHEMKILNTPLRDDAFEISDEEKIDQIEHYFKEIMSDACLFWHF